jgi:hypothetical protein
VSTLGLRDVFGGGPTFARTICRGHNGCEVLKRVNGNDGGVMRGGEGVRL